MIAMDPPSRNAFMPRALPATVFGPAQGVPGGMIVIQDNKLKEVVNIQSSELDAKEIAYAKLHMREWGQPFAPTEPPTGTDWDASKAEEAQNKDPGELYGQDLMPHVLDEERPEAPQAEELPEVPRIRPEEILETLDSEPHESMADGQHEGGSVDPPQAFRVKVPSVLPDGGGAAHSRSQAFGGLRKKCILP